MKCTFDTAEVPFRNVTCPQHSMPLDFEDVFKLFTLCFKEQSSVHILNFERIFDVTIWNCYYFLLF